MTLVQQTDMLSFCPWPLVETEALRARISALQPARSASRTTPWAWSGARVKRQRQRHAASSRCSSIRCAPGFPRGSWRCGACCISVDILRCRRLARRWRQRAAHQLEVLHQRRLRDRALSMPSWLRWRSMRSCLRSFSRSHRLALGVARAVGPGPPGATASPKGVSTTSQRPVGHRTDLEPLRGNAQNARGPGTTCALPSDRPYRQQDGPCAALPTKSRWIDFNAPHVRAEPP